MFESISQKLMEKDPAKTDILITTVIKVGFFQQNQKTNIENQWLAIQR